MALTGQLSDMSLAELIEFFCNQRKTGRLKIDYPRGHSVFFIREGELVDAKVGALSGVEAVYFSLTLPNAAFDFSPDVQATRRTIDEKWTQVVLEGLRRLDEGLSPTEVDAFGGWSPTESELAQMLDQVEHLDASSKSQNGHGARNGRAKSSAAKGAGAKASSNDASASDASSAHASAASAEPFSMMVESASAGGGGSKKKLVLAAVAAAVLLACAAAAVPFMRGSGAAAPAAAVAPQPAAPAKPEASADSSADAAPADSADASNAESAEASAASADAARREAVDRERRDRERRRKEEAAKKDDSADAGATDSASSKPLTPPAAPAGPKSVRVTVTYDEAGRVTQASVAGTTPGAEAYGSTAVRIARGKRFPTGKSGSTVVTIPVN
jgi:hypothetical protein